MHSLTLRHWCRASIALMALLLIAVVLVGTAPHASAAPTGKVMTNTQRMSGASLKTTQYGWYLKGSTLTLKCHVRGQSVWGYYGGPSNLWYQVSDGRYVADIDLNTGSNNPVAPACSNGATMYLPFTGGTTHRVTQSPGGGYSHTNQYNRTAIDFAARKGETVRAMGSGRIYSAGWNSVGGIVVLVDHGSGRCTQYAHLSRKVVNRGARVNRGAVIGYVGGSSSGRQDVLKPHLHVAGVACSTQLSLFIPNTVEAGTNYPTGKSFTSRNSR
jgi:hypothetical protein